MTPAEAEAALSSEATEERLKAARHYSRSARAVDLPLLRRALSNESVPWIQRALRIALGKANNVVEVSASPVDGDLLGLDARQIFAKASEEVAGGIVHEFAPIVGLLRVAARSELGENYEASRSRVLLDQMQSLLSAIRLLKRASAAPNFQTFGLGDLVARVVDSTDNERAVQIRVAGPHRMTVSADKDQLSLAISNGLRNAIEAVGSYSTRDPPQVIINWGFSGPENFLIIKDTGPGFGSDSAAAMRLGATTKAGHLGFGLALAQQAMSSMQGEIELRNDQDGAHFELRWFRTNEDTFR